MLAENPIFLWEHSKSKLDFPSAYVTSHPGCLLGELEFRATEIGPQISSEFSCPINSLFSLRAGNFCFKKYVKEINLLKPTGCVMHHQFNIQQLYALPTLYLCVLYLSGNKQRLVPLTA